MPPTPPPRYRLRPATAADFDFLWALHRESMRPHVEATWGWEEAFQARLYRERFDPAGQQVVIIDGAPAGVLRVEWRDTEAFLANVQVLPALPGRGIGGALVGAVVADAHARGLPVTLRVLRVNPAQRLYERLGFRIYGATDTHVLMRTTPCEHAP